MSTQDRRYCCETVKLNNGKEMPILGFGTFLNTENISEAIKTAVETGYRHIDCAAAYDNESQIGETLKEIFTEGKVKREDLFITSKLLTTAMNPSEIEKNLDLTLKNLQLDYLDLYLIHQPVPTKQDGNDHRPLRAMGWGLQDIWRVMEKLNQKGKVKSIGVSNVNAVTLNDMLCYAKIPPAVNQFERHPVLQQNKLVEFCKKEGIQVTAYSPLGAPGFAENKPSGNLLENEVILRIAKKHSKSPSQVLVRWSIDSKIVTIPKSVHPERIVQNFNIWDFKLSEQDMKEIEKLDSCDRTFDQEWCGVPMFF